MAKETKVVEKEQTQVVVPPAGGPVALATVPGRVGLVPVVPQGLEIFEDVEALDDNGLNDIKATDRRIPILRILAANSPQVTQELPGAKGGAILNTSTGPDLRRQARALYHRLLPRQEICEVHQAQRRRRRRRVRRHP
jgi:hypothetical protein